MGSLCYYTAVEIKTEYLPNRLRVESSGFHSALSIIELLHKSHLQSKSLRNYSELRRSDTTSARGLLLI